MNRISPCHIEWDRGCLLLEGSYVVYFGKKQVGKVSVQRQGLYYRFSCRCCITGSTVCRLKVQCGGIQENLGILVPVDGGFGLDTRIPAKRMREGVPEFLLVPNHDSPAGTFVSIYPEEPFSYISRLKNAFLERKNGEIGIVLK